MHRSVTQRAVRVHRGDARDRRARIFKKMAVGVPVSNHHRHTVARGVSLAHARARTVRASVVVVAETRDARDARETRERRARSCHE